jgi:peptidoglycan/xylan/chitin deacetylase (PgdA/CDA1 family)
VGSGRDYPVVRWPEGARLAVSIGVHFQEGAERSTLDGDEDTESADGSSVAEGAVSEGKRRDLQIESLFEYGPRRGLWRLLETFDRHRVKVTFFCAGLALERHPLAAREILAAGHEVAAHGYRWIPQVDLGPEEERDQIRRAVAAIEKTAGERPLGWLSRVPSVNTRALLAGEGFLYDSDACDDDLPHWVDAGGAPCLTVPHTMDLTDARFWSTPWLAGFTSPHDFSAAMIRAFDTLHAEGATHPRLLSAGLHLRISGRPSRARQIDRLITHAKRYPGVWFARRIDIARWWREVYPAHRAARAGIPR